MSYEFFFICLSAVFFVVDPLSVVPIFTSLTSQSPSHKIHTTALRACLAAAGVLLAFTLFGGYIFKVVGVTLSAFRVAGGILLLMTSLDMLRARPSSTKTSADEEKENASKEDVAIVPLAMPLLAGPGSIATVMVLMSKGHGWLAAIPVVISIALTFVATYFLFRASTWVQRVLGKSGIAILERVMGLILGALAVQFIAEGALSLFRTGT